MTVDGKALVDCCYLDENLEAREEEGRKFTCWLSLLQNESCCRLVGRFVRGEASTWT